MCADSKGIVEIDLAGSAPVWQPAAPAANDTSNSDTVGPMVVGWDTGEAGLASLNASLACGTNDATPKMDVIPKKRSTPDVLQHASSGGGT